MITTPDTTFTCDRCLAYTAVKNPEGFLVVTDYPSGWERSFLISYDLCPKCSQDYREMLARWIADTKGDAIEQREGGAEAAQPSTASSGEVKK